MKFTYDRNLPDLKKVKKNGLKVFSIFSCGGGSTMGYKMSGFDVIGNCDIDEAMMKVYEKNFKPKFSFGSGIKVLNETPDADLPKELFDIDILDGSPPCSTFSMAGLREKARGKKKKFREGQAEQVLDDLFFDFIRTTEKLRPKVFIAENVKGMIQGKAKGYTKEIVNQFEKLGYHVQLFLLNGATMGLPQRRQRIFFVGYDKKRFTLPRIELSFDYKPVVFDMIDEGDVERKPITKSELALRKRTKPGYSLSTAHFKGHRFNSFRMSKDIVAPTVVASTGGGLYHWKHSGYLTRNELSSIGSFPKDYNYLKLDHKYLIGMSVPPLMMHRVSEEVQKQRFDKM